MQHHASCNLRGWSNIRFEWYTPWDYLRSAYLKNSYNPPVDLSDAGIARWRCKVDEQQVEAKAQALMSQSEVYKVFSEPLQYHPDQFNVSNAILRQHRFNLLGKKSTGAYDIFNKPIHAAYYSVVEHEDLPGWVIKAGADRCPTEGFRPYISLNPETNERTYPEPEESLMRVAMAERVRHAVRELGFEDDVIIPQKRIVPYHNSVVKAGEVDPMRRYFVISEKHEFMSRDLMVDSISKMTPDKQRSLARKIALIVRRAGLCDTNWSNIRLTVEGKLVFLDTEPCGSMHTRARSAKRLPHSVEKCARIGLYQLLGNAQQLAIDTPALNPYVQEIARHYDEVCAPQWDWQKICLTTVLPVLLVYEIGKALLRHRKSLAAFRRKVDDQAASYTQLFLDLARDHQGGGFLNLDERIYQAQLRYRAAINRLPALVEGVVCQRELAGPAELDRVFSKRIKDYEQSLMVHGNLLGRVGDDLMTEDGEPISL